MKKLIAAVALVAGTVLRAQVPPLITEMDRQLAQLAIEEAARGPATPIPLIGERSRQLGAVYDQFLTGVLIARGRASAGKPATVDDIVTHAAFQARAFVLVAFPIDCDGQPNHPTAIRWVSTRPSPVPVQMIG